MTRTLRTARLGTTGLQITRVGFGAWAIGGGGGVWVGRTLEGVTERPPVFSKSLLAEGPRRSVSYDLCRDQVDPLLPAADLDLPAGGLAEIEGGNR